MEDGYFGQIIYFAGNFAPQNWLFCDGQLMQINQNMPLYSLLGNTYGGDGKSTFALPDLRETGKDGIKRLGFQVGKPTAIICVSGMYPMRP
jgi:microcystin-dependent protein